MHLSLMSPRGIPDKQKQYISARYPFITKALVSKNEDGDSVGMLRYIFK